MPSVREPLLNPVSITELSPDTDHSRLAGGEGQTKALARATRHERRRMALSHCRIERVAILLARLAHAAATTSCHVCIAEARKARCVLADAR